MTDGLKALMQKHAEELEREQAAHRDALALCEVYEQRIVELQSQLDAARAGRDKVWEPLPPGSHYYDGGSVIIDEDGFITRAYTMSLREMVEGQSSVPPMPFRLCRRATAPQPSAEGE